MQTGRICPRGASYYVWQTGDTLQQVALENHTTAQALQVLNPDVNFSTLPAGYEICLPSQVYTCISGREYTVRAGDTFTSIAEALGITTYELSERNPDVSPDSLTPGQILCVPDVSDDQGSGGVTDPGQIPVIPLPPYVTGPGQQQPVYPDGPQTSVPSVPVIPVVPSKPSCAAGYSTFTIRPGQTYADILIENNVSYQAMRSLNPNLLPNFLVAGRTYCAPPAGTRQLCTGTTSYTVRPSDTLATVAERFHTTPGRLLMLNPTLLPTDFSSGTIVCVP